jgi:hypothetical protein
MQPLPDVEDDTDQLDRSAGPFSRGSFVISIILGQGSTSFDDYFILGGGMGYFVIDGLAPGLQYEVWLGGDPTLHRLTPDVRYVLHFVPVLKPYVGVFYRHTFVESFDDWDSVGARGGAIYVPNGPVFVGLGAVYERLLDCQLDDCDTIGPELLIGVSF